MKIIKPDVQFITPIDGATILKRLEQCGRVCYKSEDKITEGSAELFIAGIIKRGHEAVLEHCSFTVKFICDRGVSHEIVRHRMASYCQESTRYCNYGKGKFGEEITVIEPCFWPEGSDLYWSWKNACLISEQCYFSLLKSGATPAGSPFRSTQQPENGSGYDGQHSGMAAFPEVAVFARRTSADAGSGLDSVRES